MITPLAAGTLLTVVESFGDYALKRYAQGGGLGFLGTGFGVYIGLAGLLAWIFQYLGLAITNSYWDATSNILSMIVGGVLLKETYTLKQWIGMSIVGLGLFLVGN